MVSPLRTGAPSPDLRLPSGFLERLWRRTLVKEVLGESLRPLVSIPASASVLKACSALTENQILSAPVFDEAEQVYVGLFDWRDVGEAVVKATELHEIDHGKERDAGEAVKFDKLHSEEVVDLSEVNPLYSVTLDSPLIHALEFFGKGIHRVLVASTEPSAKGRNVFVSVLSQSDLVKFMYNEIVKYSLSTKANLPISEAGLSVSTPVRDARDLIRSEQVVSLNCDDSVFEALKIMTDRKVTSIPLLNDRKEIVASISTTDIKYLFFKKMPHSLQEPCISFVNKIRQRQGLDNEGKDRSPYFCVGLDTTLDVVIGKLVATRAHRLWVVELRKVIGVITLSDILRYFTPKEESSLWHPHFVPVSVEPKEK